MIDGMFSPEQIAQLKGKGKKEEPKKEIEYKKFTATYEEVVVERDPEEFYENPDGSTRLCPKSFSKNTYELKYVRTYEYRPNGDRKLIADHLIEKRLVKSEPVR